MTKATETFKKKYLICFFVSWGLTLIPLVVFSIMGLCNGGISIVKKVCLGSTLTMVMLMSCVNIFSKLNLKLTLIWGMMLILYLCIDKFLGAILTIFLCTAVDEILVSPLKRYYQRKYRHNIDADEREALNATINTQGTEGTN